MAAHPRYQPPEEHESQEAEDAQPSTDAPEEGTGHEPRDAASPVHVLQHSLRRAFATRDVSGTHGVSGLGLALSVIAGAILAGTYLNYRGLWLF